jgi:predicted secreted protein
MAETVGVDFLLKTKSSNTVAGKSDATLSLERDVGELAPTQSGGQNFRRTLGGLQDWSIDFDSLWIANSDALNGFAPTIQVNPGTTTPPTVSHISDLTITLNRELVEFQNSNHSRYVARGPSVVSLEAEFTLDVEADTFYDASSAEKLILDAWDSPSGTDDFQLQLPNNNTNFEFTATVASVEFSTPAEDATEATVSLQSDGTLTETINGNLDTGLDDILSTFFTSSPSAFQADITTGSTGDIEFYGDVLPSTMDINIPVEGSEEGVNVSGTLDAAGALTIQEKP